jgi:hypothetical protein
MFLCRVLVGEFCLGKNGQLVPDERDAANNLLYDSTTRTLDESAAACSSPITTRRPNQSTSSSIPSKKNSKC